MVCQHLTSKTVQYIFFIIFPANPEHLLKDTQAHSYPFFLSILDILSFTRQLSLFIASAYKKAPDLLVIPDRSTQSWLHRFFLL